MAERIGEAFVVVRPDTKGFAAEADRNISGALSKTFANITKMAAAAAAAGGAALAGLGAWGLKSAAEMQQVEIAFEGIFQSGVKSKKFLDDLRAFAAKTPFEFPELARSAKMLLATGTAAEDVIPIMTKLGNVAATLGVGGPEIEGVVRALGQMAGKGKASAEELQQISEQIPGFSAIKAIAEDMGITVAEAFDQMAEGAIPAQRAIDAILAGMDKFPGAAGAMARQSTTLNGVLSTLKDTARDALIGGIAPILPAISTAINNAMPKIQASLGEVGKLAGRTLETLVGFADKLLAPLSKVLASVGQVAGVALNQLGKILDTVGPSLDGFVDEFTKFAMVAIRTLAPALREILPSLVQAGTTFLKTWTPALQSLAPAIQIVANALADVIDVIGPAGLSMLLAAKAAGSLANALGGVGDGIRSLASWKGALAVAVGLSVLFADSTREASKLNEAMKDLGNTTIPKLTKAFQEDAQIQAARIRMWNQANTSAMAVSASTLSAANAQSKFNEVLKKSPEFGQKFIDAANRAGLETGKFSQQLANHILKQAAGRVATERFNKELEKQADAFLTASEKAEKLFGATLALIDSQVGAEGATIRARQAIRDLEAAYFDTTNSADDLTQAELSAKEAMLLAAAAAGDHARKQAEASGATDGARQAVEAQIKKLEEFRDTLAPGSPLRTWLDETIGKLGKWPTDLTTNVTVKFNANAASLADLESAGGDVSNVTGRAAGGPTTRGMLYRVNEFAGQQEYWQSDEDGRILPVGSRHTASMAGDTYHITVMAPVDDPVRLAHAMSREKRVEMYFAGMA